MKVPYQLLLLPVVLGVGVGGVYLLRMFKPEPEQADPERPAPAVRVQRVELAPARVSVVSQGFIEPLTETQLAAEVAGRVIEVADALRAGERFDAGEVLLKIDPADYLAAQAEAGARLAEARLMLSQEQARSLQAVRDWETLGSGGEPSDLVARRLHVASAEAAVRAAESAVDKARRDLERTEVRAPYDGRVRQVHLDLGSFTAVGSPIADIYSSAPFEVRLPVSLDDAAFIDLGGNGVTEAELTVRAGGVEHRWTAPIVRTGAEIDRASRSLYLVARVEAGDPGSDPAAGSLLQPGLFVQARIRGITLDRAVALPQRAFAGPDTVVVVRPDETIDLRTVTVSRSQGDRRLVTAGLEDGEMVALTPLSMVVAGMPVRLLAEDDPADGDADGDAARENENENENENESDSAEPSQTTAP